MNALKGSVVSLLLTYDELNTPNSNHESHSKQINEINSSITFHRPTWRNKIEFMLLPLEFTHFTFTDLEQVPWLVREAHYLNYPFYSIPFTANTWPSWQALVKIWSLERWSIRNVKPWHYKTRFSYSLVTQITLIMSETHYYGAVINPQKRNPREPTKSIPDVS